MPRKLSKKKTVKQLRSKLKSLGAGKGTSCMKRASLMAKIRKHSK